MKIAILGGGLTGLSSAYYLLKKRHQVTIFEKEENCGGLAGGFKTNYWDWFLDKTYHHLFVNDNDILNFAEEVGFNKIFFKIPETASLYKNSKIRIENLKHTKRPNPLQIFPLDTPKDLLKFPLLSFFEKIRAGAVLTFFKISPFFNFYEKITAETFLKKTMGERVWQVLWQQLFRKKFGDYAENILTSFIWARVKKRTKKLGYFEGGFQNFINYLVKKLINLNGEILTNSKIQKIERKNNKFFINNRVFDVVISTLPTPVFTKMGQNLFPADFLHNLRMIQYLHGVTLILETKEKFLKDTYWLNICEETIPIMGIVQHTNFVDKKYYNNNHLLYLGWYLNEKDKIWHMDKQELLDFVFPHLQKINPLFQKKYILDSFYFKSYFAQPIFNKEFIKYKPNFKTPIPNFYIANLDMTYPYDRGTNYAVKLGKEVIKFILSKDCGF